MNLLPGTFEITHKDPSSKARKGRLWTLHGPVDTPVFMPVGTQAAVKAVSPAELEGLSTQIILGNAYHLLTRPGIDIIEQLGGLHRFMAWKKAILTDSGGYQVFSLAKLRKISEEGVDFQSHFDGTHFFLGPVEAIAAQNKLGSDIAMVLDYCSPYPSKREDMENAVKITLKWANISLGQSRLKGQLLFGIVQGGEFLDLRQVCAEQLVKMDFDGYAIGGVSVGEPEEILLQVTKCTANYLPENKPRYLMGVGRMHQIIEAVAEGIDMFDCVIPTRFARNGTAFTKDGRLSVRDACCKKDPAPIEEGCPCYACMNFSRAYIRHLLNAVSYTHLTLPTIYSV